MAADSSLQTVQTCCSAAALQTCDREVEGSGCHHLQVPLPGTHFPNLEIHCQSFVMEGQELLTQQMFLPHSLARILLVVLLVHLGGGRVLKRSRRQAADVPASGLAPLRSWLVDVADFEGQAAFPEAARRQGVRGPLIPGFGSPLDRISAEKRPGRHPHNVPRRRTTVPLDRIGGSYLTHRRSWSDYPEMDWDLYEGELTYSQMETAQQLMGDP
ncbi:uncharacterized protein LOC127586648 [Pristis pectinata]|uniref:uncharacterized protein LOC127586648 n=1 Tax=Pristis pectinata TaxID=685728 RepID=UPI00223E23E3|nr:uncharacterized protein LOC127586648 [Pristis pectinata]